MMVDDNDDDIHRFFFGNTNNNNNRNAGERTTCTPMMTTTTTTTQTDLEKYGSQIKESIRQVVVLSMNNHNNNNNINNKTSYCGSNTNTNSSSSTTTTTTLNNTTTSIETTTTTTTTKESLTTAMIIQAADANTNTTTTRVSCYGDTNNNNNHQKDDDDNKVLLQTNIHLSTAVEEEEDIDPSSSTGTTTTTTFHHHHHPTAIPTTRTRTNVKNKLQHIPRPYQMELVEMTKKQNMIIHLGTGTGKTFIAILLIKYKMEQYQQYQYQFQQQNDMNKKKKVVYFLVPSIALALQQSTVLRQNLPYRVATIYGGSKSSKVDSQSQKYNIPTHEVLNAPEEYDIIVMTHGCCLELLNHYSDIYNLHTNCFLLIIDECHHCRKNSPYATIMRHHYHSITTCTSSSTSTTSSTFSSGVQQIQQQYDAESTKKEKPHILGLTASPLVHCRPNHTDEQLICMIQELETLMDCKIISLQPTLNHINCSEKDYTNNDTEDHNNNNYTNMNVDDRIIVTKDHNNNKKKKKNDDDDDSNEKYIYYQTNHPFDDPNQIHSSSSSYPKYQIQDDPASNNDDNDNNNYNDNNDDDFGIHICRRNELEQLKLLYSDLGALPLFLYVRALLLSNHHHHHNYHHQYSSENDRSSNYDGKHPVPTTNTTTTTASTSIRLKRSIYELESKKQFKNLKRYLQQLLQFCYNQCCHTKPTTTTTTTTTPIETKTTTTTLAVVSGGGGTTSITACSTGSCHPCGEEMIGITHKLYVLTRLLRYEIELKEPKWKSTRTTTSSSSRSQGPESSSRVIECIVGKLQQQQQERQHLVGVVFVERRITALALKLYFQQRCLVKEMCHTMQSPYCHTLLVEAILRSFHKNKNNDDGPKSVFVTNQSKDQKQLSIGATDLSSTKNNPNKKDTLNCATKQSCRSPFMAWYSSSSGSLNSHHKRKRIQNNDDSNNMEQAIDDSSDDQFMDAEEDELVEEEEEVDEEKSTETEKSNSEFLLETNDLSVVGANNNNDDDDDQFADSEDDPLHFFSHMFSRNTVESHVPITTAMASDKPSFINSSSSGSEPNKEKEYSIIKCGALIRSPQQNMRAQSYKQTSVHSSTNGVDKESETDIKQVMKSFQAGEINVLIATSVVEEGVDVQACSFVANFDSLTTIKAYIQKKGRARHKDATFYLFRDSMTRPTLTCKNNNVGLSLPDVQTLERRIQQLLTQKNGNKDHTNGIETKTNVEIFTETCNEKSANALSYSAEAMAVQNGFFRAPNGIVTLQTAKSLLYRFIVQQPLDSAIRSTRESFTPYLPQFDEQVTVLTLPAYIEPSLRTYHLNYQHYDQKKKDREAILSLMACVRLYHNDLLTDRLLPLSKEYIRDRLVILSQRDHKSPEKIILPPSFQSLFISQTKIFVYVHRIRMDGILLQEARKALRSEGHTLCIVTTTPMEGKPLEYDYSHKEFGNINCYLDDVIKCICTEAEVAIIHSFFETIMNSRWRRRTQGCFFRGRTNSNENTSVVLPYTVGCLHPNGSFDLEMMQQITSESFKSVNERMNAVQNPPANKELFDKPRLCCTLYNKLAVYVCYRITKETCCSVFPYRSNAKYQDVTTYHDYFRVQHNYNVVLDDSPMLLCQRLWSLPIQVTRRNKTDDPCSKLDSIYSSTNSGGLCPNLNVVMLPQHTCAEIESPNAALYLELLLLPQILFVFERHLTAKAFISYCSQSFPRLATCFNSRPISEIIGLLSAKSCCEDTSYERLEWLGDGVLKLIQTDAILKSTNLRKWIRNLHEGDLDFVRSVLCCNDTLKSICERIGFHQFILTANLSRGKWIPAPQELYTTSTGLIRGAENAQAFGKTCADVLEAVLGYVFLCEGYEYCVQVADELYITVSWDDTTQSSDQYEPGTGIINDHHLLDLVTSVTGYKHYTNPILVEEAFTHASSTTPGVSCYERLEWIGDAVFCLAVRQWLFHQFSSAVVGELVSMESPLVSNETFAFLAQRLQFHEHVRYGDSTLPNRIESYLITVRNYGRSLWSTEPPKVVADILESTIGSIHVDGGYRAGQQAALHILDPVLKLYQQDKAAPFRICKNPRIGLMHLTDDAITIKVNAENEGSSGSMDASLGRILDPVLIPFEEKKVSPLGVVSIQCLGQTIVISTDVALSFAQNRACSLILAILEADKTLVTDLKTAKNRLSTKIG